MGKLCHPELAVSAACSGCWWGRSWKGLPHAQQIRVGGCEWFGGGKIKSAFILKAVFWEQLHGVS